MFLRRCNIFRPDNTSQRRFFQIQKVYRYGRTHVNLTDLIKSFPMSLWLRNLACLLACLLRILASPRLLRYSREQSLRSLRPQYFVVFFAFSILQMLKSSILLRISSRFLLTLMKFGRIFSNFSKKRKNAATPRNVSISI